MSNKPTLTNWDTALTNLIAVTAGHQTSGYATNEIPLSSELNGLFNNVTKWTSFMNDVLGTAAVAAADINIGSGGGATGTITAAGDITTGGKFKRPARVRHISPVVGMIVSATGVSATATEPLIRFTSTSGIVRYGLYLEEGEQLQSVRGYTACGVTDVITMKLFKNANTVGSTATNVDAQIGSTQTSAGHGLLTETLTVGSLTENVTSGFIHYSVEFACTAFANNPYIVGLDYTTAVI